MELAQRPVRREPTELPVTAKLQNARSLGEIEAAVLDETQPVAAALRKILVLGGKQARSNFLSGGPGAQWS